VHLRLDQPRLAQLHGAGEGGGGAVAGAVAGRHGLVDVAVAVVVDLVVGHLVGAGVHQLVVVVAIAGVGGVVALAVGARLVALSGPVVVDAGSDLDAARVDVRVAFVGVALVDGAAVAVVVDLGIEVDRGVGARRRATPRGGRRGPAAGAEKGGG